MAKSSKKTKKKCCSLGRQYKDAWQYIRGSKNYIKFSVAMLLIFTAIGFIFPVFFADTIRNLLEKISQEIAGMRFGDLMPYIFINNAMVSLLAAFGGIVIGLGPLWILIENGYVIGFVARYAIGQDGILVLWRLLPHGIFELPAIILAISLGLRLGLEIITKNKNFKYNLISMIRCFILIVLPLLLIAAIIESALVLLFR